MARKRSFGLSFDQGTVDLIDRYAIANDMSRSEAVKQLMLLGLENVKTISLVEEEIKFLYENHEKRIKNEVNRLTRLHVKQLKLSATIKGLILFYFENKIGIDAQTVKIIEAKSIEKIMDSLDEEY